MTREQIEIAECGLKSLEKLCWWDCEGCPLDKKCNSEEAEVENPPPCEKALIEAVEIVKGMIKE